MKTKSKELKEYSKYLEEEAEKFRLDADDLSNLYDFMHMAETPSQLNIDLKETLKLNKMDKWYNKFFMRIEKIVITE